MPTSALSYGFGTGPWLKENGVSFKRAEQGWDTLALEYFGQTNSPAAFADENFPTGMMLADWGFMYVTEVNIKLDGSGIYQFTVQAKGLRGNQSYKRTIGQQAQSYQTGPITIPGTGPVAQAQGTYIAPTCEFVYITTTEPVYNIEPQNRTPFGPLPAAPSNPFTSPEPTTKIYNYPNGWICENFEVETIVNAPIYLITENWTYRYLFTPG